jgi:hypothetical protein
MDHVVQQLGQALVDKPEKPRCPDQSYVFEANEDTFHRFIYDGVMVMPQENMGPESL